MVYDPRLEEDPVPVEFPQLRIVSDAEQLLNEMAGNNLRLVRRSTSGNFELWKTSMGFDVMETRVSARAVSKLLDRWLIAPLDITCLQGNAYGLTAEGWRAAREGGRAL